VLAAGFAGFGDQDHQSSMYLPALADHPGFRVVAVAPLDGPGEPGRAAEAGRSYDVPVMTSLADGLARDDVDCVSVCARPESRLAVLTEVMRAGRDVLADKPLALTADEVRRLRMVREETDRVLAVAHHHRFQPMLLAAASALAAGRVGLPWNIQADFLVAGGRPCPDGELVNFGLYPVDVLLALTGLPVRRVYALAHQNGGPRGSGSAGSGAHDLVMLSLDHDSGLTSTVVVGRTGPQVGVAPGQLAVHRYRVSGSHGTALFDATRPAVTVRTATTADRYSVDPGTVRRLLDNWRTAVLGGRPSAVSVEESLAVAEVLDAARRSLASGLPEEIPTAPDGVPDRSTSNAHVGGAPR
jgi:predicted dehydrogenase